MTLLLPDLAKDLAAHTLPSGASSGHHALGRAEDVDAQPSQHLPSK